MNQDHLFVNSSSQTKVNVHKEFMGTFGTSGVEHGRFSLYRLLASNTAKDEPEWHASAAQVLESWRSVSQ